MFEEAIAPQQVGSDVIEQAPEASAAASSAPEQAPVEEALPTEDQPKPEEVLEENLPFGKHPRWQKMVSSNREMKTKLSELEQRAAILGDRKPEQLQGLFALEQWLRENPVRAKSVYELMMKEQEAPEPQADPYEAYDPDVAAKFRELDELKNFMQDVKQREEQRVQSDIENHLQDLDTYFDGKLKTDGYLNDKGEPVNPDVIDVIQEAALSKVMAIVNEKKWISKEDVDTIYASVTRGVAAAEKQGLKKVVAPVVPATGSRAGVPALSKRPQTTEDRIALLSQVDLRNL